MGRSTEKIQIMVSIEPSEHEKDAEFFDYLQSRVRAAIVDVQYDWPEYFIDTMGLD